jgi:light-regulated signal transduction histidine kinase (bacteriophytochrome)
MSNLLGNAWKFTRNQSPALIEVGRIEKAGEKIYYVRDNGVGFDMKYSHKIFGLFQRLHHSNEYEGTGVGLATVQRIINRHHGWVRVEGEKDKGATVYFSLPDVKVPAKKTG